MSTPEERTYRVPQEDRIVFLETRDLNRTVRVPQEDRVIILGDRRTTSADRTVYATED
jgi:hypothetical protein